MTTQRFLEIFALGSQRDLDTAIEHDDNVEAALDDARGITEDTTSKRIACRL